MTYEVKLNAAEWRDELRARYERSVRIAEGWERQYGLHDPRTADAWRHAGNFYKLVRQEGA